MCEDRYRLIPVVILVAALVASLIIFFGTGVATYTVLFALVFVLGLTIIVVTGVLAAICGFHRARGEQCSSRMNVTCAVIRCLGPITLLFAALTVIIAAIALAGVLLTATIDLILGIILAITASAALVYFTGMFFDIISGED